MTSSLTIVSDKNVTIDLNGKKLTGNVNKGRAIKIDGDNVNLVINATGSTVEFGNGTYGIVEIAEGAENVKVTINGGTFTGTTNCGAFVKFRPNGNNNVVTLNNVTYTDNCPFSGNYEETNAWVINTNECGGSGNKVIVNGGTYTGACGFAIGYTSEFNDVTMNMQAAATEFYYENDSYNNIAHRVKDCNITIAPGSSAVYSAPGCCIAASNKGVVDVINSNVYCSVGAGVEGYAYGIFPTGGIINVSGGTYSGDTKVWPGNGSGFVSMLIIN